MFLHLNIAVDWFNAPQDDTATDDRSRQQDSAVTVWLFSLQISGTTADKLIYI